MKKFLFLFAISTLLAYCSGRNTPPKPECIEDSDCGANQICESGKCVATNPGCTSDADCNPGQTCNVLTGMCEGNNNTDQCNPPCSAGQICQNGTCVDQTNPCTSDADCSGKKCNVSSGECVDCLTSDDCPSGYVCNLVTYVCEEQGGGCQTNSDCGGATPFCDTATNTCVQCRNDSDCAGDQTCTNHVCQSSGCTDPCCGCADGFICDTSDPSNPQCIYAECQTDSDCSGDYICQNYQCVPDTSNCTCTPCPCPSGYQCNQTTQQCELINCTSDSDCPSGFYCDAGMCQSQTNPCQDGAPCSNDADCHGGTCNIFGGGVCQCGGNGNNCSFPCNADSDCGGQPGSCVNGCCNNSTGQCLPLGDQMMCMLLCMMFGGQCDSAGNCCM